MYEKNGVTFFPRGGDYGDHPAFVALKAVSLGDVHFPWGFFLRKEDGKTYVLPATEEDHRNALLQAFPDLPEAALKERCAYMTAQEHPGCEGTCNDPELGCMQFVNGDLYSCGCIFIA